MPPPTVAGDARDGRRCLGRRRDDLGVRHRCRRASAPAACASISLFTAAAPADAAYSLSVGPSVCLSVCVCETVRIAKCVSRTRHRCRHIFVRRVSSYFITCGRLTKKKNVYLQTAISSRCRRLLLPYDPNFVFRYSFPPPSFRRYNNNNNNTCSRKTSLRRLFDGRPKLAHDNIILSRIIILYGYQCAAVDRSRSPRFRFLFFRSPNRYRHIMTIINVSTFLSLAVRERHRRSDFSFFFPLADSTISLYYTRVSAVRTRIPLFLFVLVPRQLHPFINKSSFLCLSDKSVDA